MNVDDIETQALEFLKIIGEKLNYSIGENNAILNFQVKLKDWFNIPNEDGDKYEAAIRCLNLLAGKRYIGLDWIHYRAASIPSKIWLTTEGFERLRSKSTDTAINHISLGGISNSTITSSIISVGQNNSSYINQGIIDFDKISSLSDEEKQKLSKLVAEFENEKESKEGVWKKAKAILAFLLDKGVDVFIAVIPYVLNKMQNLL